MAHLDGLKLDAAYEYLNWYNSGWVGGFVAKQGYYSANPKTAMANLTDNERGYLLRGQAGHRRHHEPDRPEDQLGRRRSRRRLVRRALLEGRGLEQPDGPGGVHVRPVERVQRRLATASPSEGSGSGRRSRHRGPQFGERGQIKMTPATCAPANRRGPSISRLRRSLWCCSSSSSFRWLSSSW